MENLREGGHCPGGGWARRALTTLAWLQQTSLPRARADTLPNAQWPVCLDRGLGLQGAICWWLPTTGMPHKSLKRRPNTALSLQCSKKASLALALGVQIKGQIKGHIGMCVSPAIIVVTIKARHMDAKGHIWPLKQVVTTPLRSQEKRANCACGWFFRQNNKRSDAYVLRSWCC